VHGRSPTRSWADSLAAECPWKWSFGLSPLAVTNLAVRGADIRDITHQIERAHHFRPQVVIISGGINDLVNNEAPLDAIRSDFTLLLRRVVGPTRDLRFHFFIELFHNLVARPHSQLILIQFTFVSDKGELLLLASFAEANRCPESFG
jgi:hypothetical protein